MPITNLNRQWNSDVISTLPHHSATTPTYNKKHEMKWDVISIKRTSRFITNKSWLMDTSSFLREVHYTEHKDSYFLNQSHAYWMELMDHEESHFLLLSKKIQQCPLSCFMETMVDRTVAITEWWTLLVAISYAVDISSCSWWHKDMFHITGTLWGGFPTQRASNVVL